LGLYPNVITAHLKTFCFWVRHKQTYILYDFLAIDDGQPLSEWFGNNNNISLWAGRFYFWSDKQHVFCSSICAYEGGVAYEGGELADSTAEI